MPEKELLHRIAMTMIPGIGDVLGKKLVTLFGSAEAVFREPGRLLRKMPRLVELIRNASTNAEIFHRAGVEIDFLNRYKIRALFFTDQDYPRRLKHCHDSPVMLYFKGNADLNAGRMIGIVGTRSATDYGKRVTTDVVSGLAPLNIVVVSGLAYGIDSIAHRVSLDHGLATIGVLGHGLDMVYPWQNRTLAERMIGCGGLLTEFISGTKPDRMNFPKRNRIIAGLCDAIIVAEAGKKGGALITADIANSYNRDVFALPGRVYDPGSEGTNLLIRTNRAALIQTFEDIEYAMGWKEQYTRTGNNMPLLIPELTEEEAAIYGLLKGEKQAGIDEICILTGIPMSKVSASLLNLEFEGLVRCLPGKVYQLS